jgi:hypothetical protein
MSCVVSLLKPIQLEVRNNEMLMLKCLTFLALYGLWMLKNVVFILPLAGRRGAWMVLPLRDIRLCCLSAVVCSYDLWVCDVSVLFVVRLVL